MKKTSRFLSPSPQIPFLYNPQNLTREDLVDNFIVRKKTFQRIFKEIKASKMQHPEQHILIEGKRGMGKTTMLLRLSYAIASSATLNNWLIPLVFNEEEYSIRKLFKLWERIAELLGDQDKSLLQIRSKMKLLSATHDSDEAYEKACFDLLTQTLQQKRKKIILFIDNATDMFNKFSDKDAHRFRKVLQTSADLRIVAASAIPVRPFYDYRHPFYEFFKIEHLQGLSTEETFELLSTLSQRYPRQELNKVLHHNKGRIEALRRLTGGVIRTILLLFELFLDDEKGEAFQDLETILDRVTPLYKHRMDDLPPAQQEIVEAIALAWDAISVKEIAESTRIGSKIISAQLSQLVKNDMVHKIRTTTKNNLYQISERFFNIWYLMRHGRNSDRNRVIWLVRFLEEWCDEVEITARAKKHLQHIQTGNYNAKAAFHLTEALAYTKHLPTDIQHELLEKTRAYLSIQENDLAEKLSKSDLSLHQKSQTFIEEQNLEEALRSLLQMKNKDHLRIAYVYEQLGEIEKAERYYLSAIDLGQKNAKYFLAYLYQHHKKNAKQAVKLYEEAIDDGHSEAAFALGNLYLGQKKFEKAKLQFEWATGAGNMDAALLLSLVELTVFKDSDQSEATLIQVLNDPKLLNSGFEFTTERVKLMGMAFLFLLSRGQYHFLYHFFHGAYAQELQLKDRFKPIFYALLFFLKEQYPNEYLRMGPELQETVEEIVSKVESFHL